MVSPKYPSDEMNGPCVSSLSIITLKTWICDECFRSSTLAMKPLRWNCPDWLNPGGTAEWSWHPGGTTRSVCGRSAGARILFLTFFFFARSLTKGKLRSLACFLFHSYSVQIYIFFIWLTSTCELRATCGAVEHAHVAGRAAGRGTWTPVNNLKRASWPFLRTLSLGFPRIWAAASDVHKHERERERERELCFRRAPTRQGDYGSRARAANQLSATRGRLHAAAPLCSDGGPPKGDLDNLRATKELVWDRKGRKARGGLFVCLSELILKWEINGKLRLRPARAWLRWKERKGPINSTKC